ncbi:pimeloyl-ACP methyl ester carboxylesterase [Motilibacter peucedani]|uniref:Pimeloyl-ACP methyl ester carboxylesterase n=1 Tax=Motilibacter peucedani TaxID=598650 RepID=A0A420XR54_9ACTN|nr:alpha/beta hydrolase [Motilibacter peucedani]RKS75725.1 pimeloyl-ACP methyl ester carboxylesterase [Motilibacter peucedani]
MSAGPDLLSVRAGVLDVEVRCSGSRDGWPAVLLHGFPYDAHSFDRVAEILSDAGANVVVPSLRGYAGTRFVDDATMRSGQQAAVASDLLELLGALGLETPVVAGYDWGGRAACVVAALWPERVSGLVTGNGYLLQDIAGAATPSLPQHERPHWYQYYLHGERGREGLLRYRGELARLLWEEWSPTWRFSDEDFETTRPAFDNPDFVDVVVHSYRHRYGLVAGDPAYDGTERRIAERPVIGVPTIVLDGEHDTVSPPQPRSDHEPHFSALLDHRLVDAGHDLPQEAPADFARAVVDVHAFRTSS